MEPGIAAVAALVVGGYLLGSVPAAYLIARAAGADVFEVGTRNPGAANTFREVGRWAGVAVFLADALKGGAPVAAAWVVNAPLGVMVAAGAASVLGHWLPVFLRFRGGAGLATAIGAGIALAPVLAVIGLAVGALSLLVMRRTVEGAAVGYAALVGAAFALDVAGVREADWARVAAAVGLTLVVGIRALIVERAWRGRGDDGG